MAPSNSSLQVVELCTVAPPPCATVSSFPLTFFDLLWLKFHPVERLFFYSLPQLHSSFFFHTVLPKLKCSLSLTLQHFLPLAGRIVWPSDSYKPIVQYTPGDAVSVVVAQSDADFNTLLSNYPRDAVECRSFVPHLDSSDSLASVISLQITLFPNGGFCIGISTHHAVVDGKSSTMFMKAWAYLCRAQGEGGYDSSLLPELEPFLDRDDMTDPSGLENLYMKIWNDLDKSERSLKILSNVFPPILDHSVRATFELRREDLEKIRKRILQKWENHKLEEEVDEPKLSTFVLTAAYVSVCIAKAFEKNEKNRKKFAFGFTVDCRARLEPAVPENYFGNCVAAHIVEANPEEFTEEDGLVMVAQRIHSKIRKIMVEKQGVLDGAETIFSRFTGMASEGVKGIGVAGSTRFGVYRTDFGWGKPEKVEIASLDRNITMGIAESRDGKGGVEVGLVVNRFVMDYFAVLFRTGIESV